VLQLPAWMDELLAKLEKKKAPSKEQLKLLRRQLFQACWEILLSDKEFRKAYFYGMVVECFDGILRRIFIRFFSYSADYPEKYVVCCVAEVDRLTFLQSPRCLH
jgi:hypothetical protein